MIRYPRRDEDTINRSTANVIIQIRQFLVDRGYKNGDGSLNVEKTRDDIDEVLAIISSMFESEFKRLTHKKEPEAERRPRGEEPPSGDGSKSKEASSSSSGAQAEPKKGRKEGGTDILDELAALEVRNQGELKRKFSKEISQETIELNIRKIQEGVNKWIRALR